MTKFGVGRAGQRAIPAVLAGILGALLATYILVSPAAAATTRWASCSSVAFFPEESAEAYHTGIPTLRRSATEFLYCGLTLPHGATITVAKFHVNDDSTTHQVENCQVIRQKLDPPDGYFYTVAGPVATGVAEQPDYITLVDTSIDYPIVDNRHYAYWAQCSVVGGGESVVGVSVGYKPGSPSRSWASCSSLAFYPSESTEDYHTDYAARRSTTGTSLYCGLTLPHNATITVAKFHVYDPSPSGLVTCQVNRQKIDPPDGSSQTVAGPMTTTGSAGYETMADTSIDYPVVNDRYYAYFAQCSASADTAIMGVSIRFTPASTKTRWASCSSLASYPGDSAEVYHTGNPTLRREATALVYCGLTLPHGATVTAAKFHVSDDSTTRQVENCQVIRHKLDPPDGSSQTMAGPLASGVAAEPEYVTLVDTSIAHRVIDNRYYAYFAQCSVVGNGETIVGISVRYTT